MTWGERRWSPTVSPMVLANLFLSLGMRPGVKGMGRPKKNFLSWGLNSILIAIQLVIYPIIPPTNIGMINLTSSPLAKIFKHQTLSIYSNKY